MRLAAWAAGLALTLVVLATSGHGALSPPPLGSPARWQVWFDQRDPASAAFAMLRMAAVGGCWYLAATTVVGAALRLLRADLLVAVADRVTVAPVRRLLAGSLTLTLAGIGPTGLVAATAQPATSTTTTTTVGPSTSVPGRPTAVDTITMRRLPPLGAEPEPPAPTVPPAAAPPPADSPVQNTDRWTVRPGDCFWTIADEVLQRAWGRSPTDAEIVPYWQRLIEANRSELADPSNADLIFPAQVFTIPAPPTGEAG